jgi:hypothetical protein
VGGLFQEAPIILEAFSRVETVGGARVDAILTEVAIQRADVAVLVVESAQVAKSGAALFGRDCGIFPAFPSDMLAPAPRLWRQDQIRAFPKL